MGQVVSNFRQGDQGGPSAIACWTARSVLNINHGKQAEAILTGKGEGSMGSQELDAVFVGRHFRKEPGLVWWFADEVGIQITIANQIKLGFEGRPRAQRKRERL
ncbi:hypothetical protein LZ554_001404 [Drepanopeziza brunnea f. sp. 'monogermtubi']|nr:hypothetical protein LZ554_001404 [Drepanopeziza brunnea f. sp. 'monogermtubi']